MSRKISVDDTTPAAATYFIAAFSLWLGAGEKSIRRLKAVAETDAAVHRLRSPRAVIHPEREEAAQNSGDDGAATERNGLFDNFALGISRQR